MVRMKTLSIEERLQRKRESEKRRRDKMNSNPASLLKYKEENRAKYLKKKERGIVKPIANRSWRAQQIQRQIWRANSVRYRDRKKQRDDMLAKICRESPPTSDEEDDPSPKCRNHDGVKPSTSGRNVRTRCVSRVSLQVDKNMSTTALGLSGLSRKKSGRKGTLKSRTELLRENTRLKQQLRSMKRLAEEYKKQILRSSSQPKPSSSTPCTGICKRVRASKVEGAQIAKSTQRTGSDEAWTVTVKEEAEYVIEIELEPCPSENLQFVADSNTNTKHEVDPTPPFEFLSVMIEPKEHESDEELVLPGNTARQKAYTGVVRVDEKKTPTVTIQSTF